MCKYVATVVMRVSHHTVLPDAGNIMHGDA